MKRVLLSLILIVVAFIFTSNAQSVHNHRLAIVNESGNTVTRIYITRTGYSGWGVDLLGNNVLGNGRFTHIDLLGHVGYDFKAVESTGATCTLYNILLDTEKAVVIGEEACGVITKPQR